MRNVIHTMKAPLQTAILLVLLQAFSCAGELLDPAAVFGSKEVCISDGSSLYLFHPDGKFHLEPLGLSGRTVEGSWKRDSGIVKITGKWGWVNGLSKEDDFREMEIHISALHDTTREQVSKLTGSKHRVHHCYFLIERLGKKSPEPP